MRVAFALAGIVPYGDVERECACLRVGLVIIGVDHRIAPASLVERLRDCGSSDISNLSGLLHCGDIDEALFYVLPTCSEVVVASPDPVKAANSVLSFLADRLALTRDEWKVFYRFVDEAAAAHLFGLAAQADGEQAAAQLQLSWARFRKNGQAGRVLRELAEATVAHARAVHDGPMHQATSAAARHFWSVLQAESALPDSVIARREVEAICAEEIASFRRNCGGLMTDDQERAVRIVTARISQRVGDWISRPRPSGEVQVKESRKYGQE